MSITILRGGKNFLSQQIAACEPWSFIPNVPPQAISDKGEYTKWRSDPATDHLVYFASEGVNPAIRVSKTNPLRKIHAIVADFDAKISDVDFETVLERAPVDLRPAWVHRTMHSGGVRLIWMLEKPFALEVPQLAKRFMKIVERELRVNKIFGGFDESAFQDLSKPWDVGRDWRKLTDGVLSNNILTVWMFEAAKQVNWDDIGEISVPLDRVAEEVERQYPGRWTGVFDLDKRGVAFWDPNSTNDSSAIVKATGMVCYSTPKLFYSWTELLGVKFIREFQADKIGAAVAGVWYDGRSYHWKSSFGTWEPHSREDYVGKLKVRNGIDARTDPKATASEMDQALVFVQETKRVTGVLPEVFNFNETVYYNGKRYLNNATVKPMDYADTPQEWGTNFPWIAEFLDTCFDPTLVPCVEAGRPPMPAKEIFLCWWQRFYVTALSGVLEKGQGMFLAGGVNLGKTLLSTRIIGPSVGGASDASDFLNVNTQFNKELLEVALWCIDDAVASHDPQAHQKFSEMIKRAVANPFFNYRAMYRDSCRVTWNGRPIVTLNDDASSIRVIPNLDASIADKIIVLRFAEMTRQFPDSSKLMNILQSELPFILRWILDWKPPIALTEGASRRFGMHSYIDETLRIKSLHAGGTSDMLELNELWIKRSGNNLREKWSDSWEGSATEWFSELSQDEALRHLVSKFTVRQLGRKFVEASRIAGSGISVIEGRARHANLYRIDLTDRKRDLKEVRAKIIENAKAP